MKLDTNSRIVIPPLLSSQVALIFTDSARERANARQWTGQRFKADYFKKSQIFRQKRNSLDTRSKMFISVCSSSRHSSQSSKEDLEEEGKGSSGKDSGKGDDNLGGSRGTSGSGGSGSGGSSGSGSHGGGSTGGRGGGGTGSRSKN